MQSINKAPNPARFANYIEFPDKKGFYLPEGGEFEYDEYRGWYDEYDNYYDKDGVPCDPPKDDDSEEELTDEEEEKRYAEFDNYKDDLLEEYEQNLKISETEDNYLPYLKDYYQDMLKTIENYPENKEIIIELSNLKFEATEYDIMDFFTGRNEIKRHFIKKIILYKGKNEHLNNGRAKILTNSKQFAKECIQKQEKMLKGRKVYIDVLKALDSPIKNNEIVEKKEEEPQKKKFLNDFSEKKEEKQDKIPKKEEEPPKKKFLNSQFFEKK